MTRLITGLLVLLCSVPINAQNNISRIGPPPISPQQFQEESASIQDQDSLVKYITLYALQNVHRSPQIATTALQRLGEIQDAEPRQKLASESLIKAYLYRAPKPDSALFYANSSIRNLKEINEHRQVVSAMLFVGELYSRSSRQLEAEEIYMEAIKYHRENGVEEIPESYLQDRLTTLYMRVGAIDIALKYYNERLDSETSP